MRIRPALFLALALAGPALPAAGQERPERIPDSRGEPAPRPALRPLGVAKWSTLVAALGVGAYGFRTHLDADERFERLERTCAADPGRCAARLPDGAYADPELEALYQSVVRLDRRARLALIASQVGVGASVLLFVLDLRDGGGPRNIPFRPRSFRVAPRPDGVELQWALPAPGRPPAVAVSRLRRTPRAPRSGL